MLPPEKAKEILNKCLHDALKYASTKSLKKTFIKEIKDNLYGHYIDYTVRHVSRYITPIALEEIKLFVKKELRNGDPEIWQNNYRDMYPGEFIRLTELLLDRMTGEFSRKLN